MKNPTSLQKRYAGAAAALLQDAQHPNSPVASPSILGPAPSFVDIAATLPAGISAQLIGGFNLQGSGVVVDEAIDKGPADRMEDKADDKTEDLMRKAIKKAL